MGVSFPGINPGIILNSEKIDKDKWVPVALKGRIPVKVQRGIRIKKGDVIYASIEESWEMHLYPNPM